MDWTDKILSLDNEEAKAFYGRANNLKYEAIETRLKLTPSTYSRRLSSAREKLGIPEGETQERRDFEEKSGLVDQFKKMFPTDDSVKKWKPQILVNTPEKPKEEKPKDFPKEPPRVTIPRWLFITVLSLLGIGCLAAVGLGIYFISRQYGFMFGLIPTNTPAPVPTATPVPTEAPLSTLTPTLTPTSTITLTPTETPTLTPTYTWTPSWTPQPQQEVYVETRFRDGIGAWNIIGSYRIEDGSITWDGNKALTMSIGDESWTNYEIFISFTHLDTGSCNLFIGTRKAANGNNMALGVVRAARLGWFTGVGMQYTWIEGNEALITDQAPTLDIKVTGNTFDWVGFKSMTMEGYPSGGIQIYTTCNKIDYVRINKLP